MKKLIMSAILLTSFAALANPIDEAKRELFELRREVMVSIKEGREVKSCFQVGQLYEKAVQLKEMLNDANQDVSVAAVEIYKSEQYLALFCMK